MDRHLLGINLAKQTIEKEIYETFKKLCTKDFTNCPIPGCGFYKMCSEDELNPLGKCKKLKSLKSLQSRVNKYYYKFSGIENPNKGNRFLWDRVNELIGDVFQHELVKDDKDIIKRLKGSNTIKNVLKVMDRAYLKKHGKMYKSYRNSKSE